jgi:diacylglycerol kinase (ATP)
VIIPPSWIVKLPRKGSFKSSIRHSPKKVSSDKSAGREIAAGVSEDAGDAEACLCGPTAASGGRGPAGGGGSGSSAGREHQTFLLKPIPVSNSCPVIVFLNPKSGGNQGC